MRAELILLLSQTPRLRHREIAEILDITVDMVSHCAKRLIGEGAVEPRNGLGWMPPTREQEARIKAFQRLRDQGKTWQEIGREFGVTHQAVHRFAAKHGLNGGPTAIA